MVHISLRQNRHSATDQNTLERHSPGPGSPLTEIPGDGCYDWAGRRLFFPDGQADPNTPGAYRYQHSPDCTDLTAPDSDPNSPRYEPPHLRHQPGDTFEIGGKPDDPEDPGPYGAPGWYQDRRTGRHRRGELPDPLPPEADTDTEVEAEAPPRPHRRRPLIQPDRPSPEPRPRRHWFEPEPAPDTEEADEPYRFSRLREDAWDRWLIDSAPLAAAHTQPNRGHGHGRTITALLAAFAWLIALITGTSREEHDPAPVESERPKPWTGNGYIASWELAFDARHPATRGELA